MPLTKLGRRHGAIVRWQGLSFLHRSRRPVLTGQKSNFYITDEPELLGRIEITHAPFVKINYAARFKWSNIVDLDDDILFATLN